MGGTDGRTDERTNERTDIRITIYPRNFVCGGYKNLDYSSYSYFSCRRFENIRNAAGVNHSRCCAIAEILWSRSRLPEISKFYKSETATLSQLHFMHHMYQMYFYTTWRKSKAILNSMNTFNSILFNLSIF